MRGRYYDGKTARVRLVEALACGDRLTGFDAEGEAFAWGFDDVRVDVEPTGGGDGALTLADSESDARLVLDGEAFAELMACLPAGVVRGGGLRYTRRGLVWSGVAAAVVVGLFIGATHVLAPALARWTPDFIENELGDAAYGAISAGYRVCSTTEGVAALDSLVAPIEEAASRIRPVELKVRVFESGVANAFALPGGHIGVFSRLIEEAESPEELAGVLAHESAHIVRRHGLERLARIVGWRGAIRAAFGDAAGLALAVDIAGFLGTLKYSRDAESQADADGYAIAHEAGFDPRGLSAFLRRLSEDEDDSLFDELGEWGNYLRSHPPSASRAEALDSSGNSETYEPALSPEEWQALREICDDNSDDGSDAAEQDEEGAEEEGEGEDSAKEGPAEKNNAEENHPERNNKGS